MQYEHLSKRYVSLYDGKWGIVRTLEELDRQFKYFAKLRPEIYTDFRVWIDNLVAMGVLIPF